MRPRVLVPLACVVALFVVPAAASAKLVVGISENSPSLFLDPTFKKLHAKHVRVVVSYDVMTRKDDEVARVSDYLSRARSAGIEPLVTFEHSRGDASKCNRKNYIKKFRRALKVKRTICGVHNYSDVNRFRQTGTKALIKALGCKQIWLTETGGLFKFGSFWTKKTRRQCKTASACQMKATK